MSRFNTGITPGHPQLQLLLPLHSRKTKQNQQDHPTVPLFLGNNNISLKENDKLTFRDPHSSTVSASFTTFILKYSVWKSSFKIGPCSSVRQPVAKKRKIFLYDNNINYYGKESEVEGWRGNNLWHWNKSISSDDLSIFRTHKKGLNSGHIYWGKMRAHTTAPTLPPPPLVELTYR